MPNIILGRAHFAPNHPEDRRVASTYMSYVKRWAREGRADFLPYTMTQWTRAWARMTDRTIRYDVYTIDNAYNALQSTTFEEMTPRMYLTTPQDKLVFIQIAMNAVSYVHQMFNQQIHWKIDYILPIGPGSSLQYFPDREVSKFNGRCMFALSRGSYGILDQCITDNQSRAFWDKIISLYRGMHFNYRIAHPRHLHPDLRVTWDIQRRQNINTTVTLGRHEGDPTPQRPELDTPNGHLAEEYVNRTDSEEMSQEEVLRILGAIPVIPSEVMDILFANLTASDLYDMIMISNFSEEIA